MTRKTLWLLIIALLVLVTSFSVFQDRGINRSSFLILNMPYAHADHDKVLIFPMLVKVHADWCPACQNITSDVWPTLQKKYMGKVEFITLDVTDSRTTAKATKEAKFYGLAQWFEQNKTRTSLVALIDPRNKSVIKAFINEANPRAYEFEIERFIQTQ